LEKEDLSCHPVRCLELTFFLPRGTVSFFFTKKKKNEKEVGNLRQVDRPCGFFAFSGDELVKIKTQVCLILTKTLELSKIPCYFYKFILGSLQKFFMRELRQK